MIVKCYVCSKHFWWLLSRIPSSSSVLHSVLLCFANIIYYLFLSLRVPKESQDHLVNREPQELRWGQLVILILSLSNCVLKSFEIPFENIKVKDVHPLHWSLIFVLFHAGNARPSGTPWTPRRESRKLYIYKVTIKLLCKKVPRKNSQDKLSKPSSFK